MSNGVEVDSVEAIMGEQEELNYMVKLGNGVEVHSVEAVVNQQDDFNYMVKSGKTGFSIPSRQIRDVKCWVRGCPGGVQCSSSLTLCLIYLKG